jgi:hypothetical protein
MNLRDISVADGNGHFKVISDFLVDFDGISIRQFFENHSEVTIPKDIEILGEGCFAGFEAISRVIFESHSKLSRIERCAFLACSSLLAISIPSSVEALCRCCFCGCNALSMVTFESGSRLSRIEDDAFQDCRSLACICIPASVTELSKCCFENCESLSSVTFEPGSMLSYALDYFVNLISSDISESW